MAASFFGNKAGVKPAAAGGVAALASRPSVPAPPVVALTPEQQHAALAQRAFGGGRLQRAAASERGQNEKPGRYVERIDEVFLLESAQKAGVIFFIVKKTILFPLQAQEGHPMDRTGDQVSQVLDMTKTPTMGNIKTMLAKILDIPVDQVDPEGNGGMATVVTAPDQPLAGTIVETNKVLGKTTGKESGGVKKDFTFVNYLRRVPPAELLAEAASNPEAAATIARFFPGDSLKLMAEAEAAGAVEQPAQG